MDFRNFFTKITAPLLSKSYFGIMNANELPSSDSKKWGKDDFLSAFEISLYVNKALDKRANKVSEIEFILNDARGNPIKSDPLLDLLYKPNSLFTGRGFWKLYQLYYDIYGEVYIWLVRGNEFGSMTKVKEMHLLYPIQCEPKFGDDGSLKEVVYKKSNGEEKYQAENIIYIHNPDPRNPLRGTSLLRAGINPIDTETQISSYHSRILKNGGKVEGIFSFKTPNLTKEQLDGLKDGYKKEYATAKKAGMPLFMGGDSSYIKTGLNPEELSYLEAKKTCLEDICILTSVPKSLLASTNDAKFDNADADRVIFLRETINPLDKILTTALDEKLFPDGRNLSYVDPTPENTEEKRKNLEAANNVNALTTNEKRAYLKTLGLELEPVKSGDDILVPFNLTPLGQEEAQEPAPKDNKKGLIEHPLKDYGTRRSYWKMQIKRMEAREAVIKRALKTYFSEQSKRVVSELEISTPKNWKRKNLIEDAFKIEIEVEIGKKKFIPILTELLKQAGIDAKEFAGSAGAFNMTAEISSWIESKADIFLRRINQTTLEELKQSFTDSLALGEGREKLIKRIQDNYGQINKARAGMIARTETHNASQYGTMAGYKQAGMSIKIWVAVIDGATRDSHASLDGEERPIDIPFSNGLNYPGDPNGSAAEVINCRCVV